MKWDFLIYARGVAQEDGYALRTEHAAFDMRILQSLQPFYKLKSLEYEPDEVQQQLTNHAFTEDPDAWKHSLLCIAAKQLDCCLLVRTVQIEDASGEPMLDFTGRPLWSLEGICCSYAQRHRFWAELPSLLLWFWKQGTSLRSMQLAGTLPPQLELPEELHHNPLCDATLHPEMEQLGTEAIAEAFQQLITDIYSIPEPHHFAFGPLASYFQQQLSRTYGIQKLYSTLSTQQLAADCPPDAFFQFEQEPLRRRQVNITRQKLKLCWHTVQDKKAGDDWQWELIDEATGQPVMQSRPEPFDAAQGITAMQLKCQAEAIRQFAAHMHWEVTPFSLEADPKKLYQFVKEA